MFREGLIPFTQNLKIAIDILDEIGKWATKEAIDQDEMDVEFTSLHGKIRITVDFAPSTIDVPQINSIADHIKTNFGLLFEIDERLQANMMTDANKYPYVFGHNSDYFRIVLVTRNCIV